MGSAGGHGPWIVVDGFKGRSGLPVDEIGGWAEKGGALGAGGLRGW